MTQEQQVCSLELAKKLKELGVKQESLFYWIKFGDIFEIHQTFSNLFNKGLEQYSAFTVAELGEMLPKTTKYFRSQVTGDVMEGRGSWPYYAELWRPEGKTITENADTEADARAKMLVYLIENKLLEIK